MPALLLAALATVGTTSASASADPGSELYLFNCIACHGAGLEGIDGAGPALATSPFVVRQTVAGLVAFLKAGRLRDDPASVSGRSMPAFAWLPETDLQALAAWLKSRSAP
jgi:mono/diheme cytochrome c family protein